MARTKIKPKAKAKPKPKPKAKAKYKRVSKRARHAAELSAMIQRLEGLVSEGAVNIDELKSLLEGLKELEA